MSIPPALEPVGHLQDAGLAAPPTLTQRFACQLWRDPRGKKPAHPAMTIIAANRADAVILAADVAAEQGIKWSVVTAERLD